MCKIEYQKKALKMVDAILVSPQAQDTPDDNLRKKKLIDGQDKNGETGYKSVNIVVMLFNEMSLTGFLNAYQSIDKLTFKVCT